MTGHGYTYDRETDFLTVRSVEEDTMYDRSIVEGEIGISIDTGGTIVSVEVMNASQLFGISPAQFDGIEDAWFETEERGGMVLVRVHVSYADGDRSSQYGVSLETGEIGDVTA